MKLSHIKTLGVFAFSMLLGIGTFSLVSRGGGSYLETKAANALDSSLVACYDFNDSSNPGLDSVSGHNLVSTGLSAPTISGGVLSTSTSSGLHCGDYSNNPIYLNRNNNITVCFKAKMDGNSGSWSHMLSLYSLSEWKGPRISFNCSPDNVTHLRLTLQETVNSEDLYWSQVVNSSANSYHVYSLVISGSSYSLYIDGASVNLGDSTGPSLASLDYNPSSSFGKQSFSIGGIGTWGASRAATSFDYLKVYNKAFSSTDASRFYSDGGNLYSTYTVNVTTPKGYYSDNNYQASYSTNYTYNPSSSSTITLKSIVDSSTSRGYAFSNFTASGVSGLSILGQTLTIPANAYGDITVTANWTTYDLAFDTYTMTLPMSSSYRTHSFGGARCGEFSNFSYSILSGNSGGYFSLPSASNSAILGIAGGTPVGNYTLTIRATSIQNGLTVDGTVNVQIKNSTFTDRAPMAKYSFLTSNAGYDSSGNGYDLTTVGTVSSGNGVATFNGTDSILYAPTNKSAIRDALNGSQHGATISFTVQTNTVGTDQWLPIVSLGRPAYSQNAVLMSQVAGTNHTQFAAGDNVSAWDWATEVARGDAASTFRCTISMTTSKIQVYINNAQKFSDDAPSFFSDYSKYCMFTFGGISLVNDSGERSGTLDNHFGRFILSEVLIYDGPCSWDEAIELSCKDSLSNYNVTIDANGGTGGSANPSSYIIKSEAQTVALTQPTKTGYTFTGWELIRDGWQHDAVADTGISGDTLTIQHGSIGHMVCKANWSINSYPVSITAGTGVSSVYLSTTSTATSGSTSGTSYNYGTTVYGFAVLARGYNAPSGWYLVSGTANTEGAKYRTGSLSVNTSGNDFGTKSATIKQFTVSIASGTGVSSVYLSTNSGATSGDASGTSYNYGTTVYGFAVLKAGYNGGAGWVLVGGTRDSEGAKYLVGNVTVDLANADLGTQNTTPKTFTITYNNGGHGTAPSAGTATYNQNYTIGWISGTTDGFVFEKWSGSDGNTYDAGYTFEPYQKLEGLTLTATWSGHFLRGIGGWGADTQVAMEQFDGSVYVANDVEITSSNQLLKAVSYTAGSSSESWLNVADNPFSPLPLLYPVEKVGSGNDSNLKIVNPGSYDIYVNFSTGLYSVEPNVTISYSINGGDQETLNRNDTEKGTALAQWSDSSVSVNKNDRIEFYCGDTKISTVYADGDTTQNNALYLGGGIDIHNDATADIYFKTFSDSYTTWITGRTQINICSGENFYIKDSGNWRMDNAKLAVWFMGSSGDAFSEFASLVGDAADSTSDKYYEVTAPQIGGVDVEFTGFIIVRLASDATTPDWGKKWDQTDNLSFSSSNDCYREIVTGTLSGDHSIATIGNNFTDYTRVDYYSRYFRDVCEFCDDYGSHPTELSSNWNSLSSQYSEMSIKAQSIFTNTTADGDEAKDPSSKERVASLYDYVVPLYSLDDFASRDPELQPGSRAYSSFGTLSEDQTALVIIVASSALLLISLTSTSLLLAKRKHKQK